MGHKTSPDPGDHQFSLLEILLRDSRVKSLVFKYMETGLNTKSEWRGSKLHPAN